MKLTILLIFLAISQIMAVETYSQSTRLSLNLKSVAVKDVLDQIEQKSEFVFLYNSKLIDVERTVSVNVKDQKISDVLDKLFQDVDVVYTVVDRQIVLTNKTNQASLQELRNTQQQKSVSGKVTDSSGSPLPGVSVVVKGTTTGTITDAYGNFSLSNIPENATLQFSFVGMKMQDVKVGTQTSINVVLAEETVGIEEVVAVGYGTSRKKDLTGAVVKVNTEKMSELPNVNAVQTLRGSVAGVSVVDNGRPGSDGSIIVRGKTSISANNEPLIVLDGIPYTGGKLSDINSNDIESIDILKDASSAAIYGSRATNGVILITTKKGFGSKPKLNYNTYFGFSEYAHTPKMMGSEKYIQLKKDAEAYKGQLVQLEPLEQANYDAGITIDPWEEISQDAPLMSHELSVSGKNENITYYISGSYNDVKGVVMGDNFSRMTLRANFDIKVTDWIKLGMNSGYTFKDYSGIQADLYFTSYLSPYANLYYDDGVPRPQPMNSGLVWNPLSSTLLDDNKDISQTLFSNVYTDIELPVSGLTYRLNVGTTQRIDEQKNYSPQFIRETYYNLGAGSKYYYKVQSLTLENIVKYKKTIADLHNIEATFMYGFETMKDESSNLSSNNIFNDALGWNALEIGENYNINTGAGESHAVSAMARVGYRYGEKYMINATVRRDGYSAFGNGKKYGIFPSLGLGWNISEESFMQDIHWLDMLKLRVSYGKNGNRAINRYASLSSMNQINYVFDDGGSTSIGLYPSSIANPELGWETTTAVNYGVDFNILNNRISGSLEYYQMKTSDLLLYRRIPNMTGYEGITTNIGATSNKGFELSLNTENIRVKDFVWTTNFVFSMNRNKITKLSGNDLNGDGVEDDDIASNWFIGKPLGAHFDYVFDGIWQEGDDMSIDSSAKPGYIRFKDISGPDGVPDGKISADDRKVINSDNPDFLAGLTNTFTYKGFSLSTFFNIRQGGYKANNLLNLGTNYFDWANVMDLPYWTPESPLPDRPSVGYPNPYGYGFYESIGFVRLQDLSLSYAFPKHLLGKTGIDDLKVYISGKNLHNWTKWHGWDPEHGVGGRGNQNSEDTGPLMKTWTIGLNITL